MAVRLFNSLTLNGATDGSIDSSSVFLTCPKSMHTVTYKVTDANNSLAGTFTITLYGAPEGRDVTDANATWKSMAADTITLSTGGSSTFSVVDMPAKRIKIEVTDLTGTPAAADVIDAWYIEGTI